MDNDKIEYLKRAIKRNYKRYTGERTDGTATLMDVLKLFNIYIDESRIEDYSIESIDYSIPSIKVIDKKTNTIYTSKYTSNADLLNYSGGGVRFIRLSSVNNNRRIDSLFYIGSETPIIEKMTFTNGDYDLVFEREMDDCIEFGLDAKAQFTVIYVKNVYEKERTGKQQLLSKIFQIYNNNETFEQTYTYDQQYLIEYDDSQDKYCCTQNGNIIYGVNDCDIKELIHYLYGGCFESTSVNVSKYLPINIRLEDFPALNDKEMYQSGIVFEGGTGTDNGIHHVFTIFKAKNQATNIIGFKNKINYDIYLNYEATKWEDFKQESGITDCRKKVVAHKEARYPRMDDGNITSLEIRNIIEMLDTEFKDNTFIQLVINELKTFADKMDIQKGILEEELEPLSPKIFIDKSFDEIYALVNANKDDYFRLINEQFIAATNIKKEKNPVLIKTFKKDDE